MSASSDDDEEEEDCRAVLDVVVVGVLDRCHCCGVEALWTRQAVEKSCDCVHAAEVDGPLDNTNAECERHDGVNVDDDEGRWEQEG